MIHKQSSYRTIAKGTAIFGGVQVFNILLNVIRGKLVAILLGPAGMGVSSLFTSTTGVINQFSSFGLSLSGVKDISEANEQDDKPRLSRIVAVFRKLVLFTGLLAATVAITGAPYLSQITFGNRDYIWEFAALSIMLLFTALNSAETALLQGTRRLKYLAKSSIIGSVSGVIAGIPLYFFWGTKGIVPAMIILAGVSYFINEYFTSKIPLDYLKIPVKKSFQEGWHMVSLGIVMMAALLIGTFTTYIINIYIRKYGNLDDVGLYQAATSITSQYIGLVFSAMAVDYFPRLAAVCKDKTKMRETVCNQLDIVMPVVTPLLILIILTAPLLVKILLTDDFLPVIPLLRWLSLGIFFKALAYPIGYISFSSGDKKTFFWLEGIYGNAMTLTLSILGYMFWGLTGLGVAMAVSFCLYFIILSVVTKIRYDFMIHRAFLKTIIPLFLATFASFMIFQLCENVFITYSVTSLLLIAISVYSYKELDKRLGIKELAAARFKKK